MSSAELHPQQLDVRYHDLDETDCNRALFFAPSVNPSPMSKAQKTTLPSTDELQLHQMKLPLKLPQRRKFITLAEANSASFGLKVHHGLENSSSLGSSVFQKALDLTLAKGQEETSEQVELPAKSEEEAFHEAEEIMKTKKKLLAQLAKNPGAVVDSQPEFQQNESRFHRSSNSSRTCRFCGREFSSGRSLGGHMRVHGDLLFADTSPHMVEQEDRYHREPETVGSVDQMDPSVSGRRVIEEMKPNSFTSSSNSSQMNLQEPSQAIKLDRHGQEDVEEEEELDDAGEKVTRMVNLSSFQCTSLVSKPVELLGCVDSSSELLTGKSKVVPASTLYQLRRNPKPNQRFFGDQESGSLSYAIWQNSAAAASGTVDPRSRSPTTEHDCACSECGKIFSSCKALFGHMRCHPERDWRGIQPPERSNELDRHNRSIIPKTNSEMVISSARNILNCVEPTGSALSNAESKEKFPAKLQRGVSSKSNVLITGSTAALATRETASFSTQKSGACMDMESRQCTDHTAKIFEQAEDSNAHGPAFLESRKDNTKKTVDHLANKGTKETPKVWSTSWHSTGKRSKRHRSGHLHHELSLTSEATSIELGLSQHDMQLADEQEELDMANCLVLLSSACDIKQEMGRMHRDRTKDITFPHQSKKRRVSLKSICLQRLSRAGAIQAGVDVLDHANQRTAAADDDCDEVENKSSAFSVDNYVKAENHESFNSTEVKYQCFTCKKCFNSHQALGGHRASHKKMKGCFAQMKNLAKEAQESSEENVTEDDLGMEHNMGWQSMALQGERQTDEAERSDVYGESIFKESSRKSKIKGHECSICHRIFASGQALGGHKRCHWNSDQRLYVTDTASVASSNIKQSSVDGRPDWGNKRSTGMRHLANEETIDLNLPAPFDEDDEVEFNDLPAQDIAVKEEEAGNSLMDCSVALERQISTQQDWKDCITKDLLGGHSASSSLEETRSETEDGVGCDQRLRMWSQKWDIAAIGTSIPQVCSSEDPLNVSEKTALTTW